MMEHREDFPKVCISRISEQARAVGTVSKFWVPGSQITAKFVSGTASQHDLVELYSKEWCEHANLVLKFVPSTIYADIRISFDTSDGSWSYVGTDCRNISSGKPTMNFGWLDKPVVLHEFGHAIGLQHEHQNPEGGIQWNVDNVVKDLSGPPNNWDYNTIIWNVIRTLDEDQVMGTRLDKTSIMMYRIPKHWTLDGFFTEFNRELSDMDKEFVSRVYPSVGPDEHEIALKVLSAILVEQGDFRGIREDVLVRMGRLLGLPTDMKLQKKKNLNMICDKIFNR